jgi:hypothetical protein
MRGQDREERAGQGGEGRTGMREQDREERAGQGGEGRPGRRGSSHRAVNSGYLVSPEPEFNFAKFDVFTKSKFR